MTDEGMPKNYGLLKGIVITLGILIIAMVILLVVASVMKYNDQKRAEAALVEKYQESRPVAPSANSQVFEMDLKLEPGQEIISAQSSDQGILVRIGQNGKTRKILLIDYNGIISGTININ